MIAEGIWTPALPIALQAGIAPQSQNKGLPVTFSPFWGLICTVLHRLSPPDLSSSPSAADFGVTASNSSADTGTYSSLTSCPNHPLSLCVFLITAHQLQFARREESAINYRPDPNTSQVNRCQIGFIAQPARARKPQLAQVGPGSLF